MCAANSFVRFAGRKLGKKNYKESGKAGSTKGNAIGGNFDVARLLAKII